MRTGPRSRFGAPPFRVRSPPTVTCSSTSRSCPSPTRRSSSTSRRSPSACAAPVGGWRCAALSRRSGGSSSWSGSIACRASRPSGPPSP